MLRAAWPSDPTRYSYLRQSLTDSQVTLNAHLVESLQVNDIKYLSEI